VQSSTRKKTEIRMKKRQNQVKARWNETRRGEEKRREEKRGVADSGMLQKGRGKEKRRV
jgi:hypothetical protein